MTSVGTVISYPVPLYANPPIQPQYYQPSQFFISAISLGFTTTVTTTVNVNYSLGQQVRLIIPAANGSRLLNGQSGVVVSIPNPNQVIININSVGVDAFIANPVTPSLTLPQILAIGDINSGQTNANGIINTLTYIPGSFINISPT